MMKRAALMLGVSPRAIAAALPTKRTVSSPNGQFNIVAPIGLTEVSIDDDGVVRTNQIGSMTLKRIDAPEPSE